MNKKIFAAVPCHKNRYWYFFWVALASFYLGSFVTIMLMPIENVSQPEPTVDEYSDIFRDTDKHVEYAVFVLSAPTNLLKRDAIRTTWGGFVNNAVVENGKKVFIWNDFQIPLNTDIPFLKVYFVIGTKDMEREMLDMLLAENDVNDDLVLLFDVNDRYDNLCYKVLSGIRYFNDAMKKLKYLVKCDDDSFVRIDLIVEELEQYAPYMNASKQKKYVTFKESKPHYNGLYWGYFNGKARIFSKGKWHEKEWFLCDKYLPYALGGGYIISHSIVKYIAKNRDILSCYNSEDVTMGVWTAALKNINRVHDIRFDTEWITRGCNDHMLVRQKQEPKHMHEMYESLVNSQGKQLCVNEFSNRNTYLYNWNGLPSNCCTIQPD